jgi:hypothetical protein
VVNLYKANQSVGYNDWPKHSAEYAINDETDTSNHIYDPDFSNIFQYKAQNNEKRSGISDISGKFGIHEKKFEDNKLNHFQ